MIRRSGAWCLLLIALSIAGCAFDEPMQESSSKRRATPPRYNLAGFSPAFKEGYADACASPRRRNAQRLKDDTDYSMGWQDGSSVCGSR